MLKKKKSTNCIFRCIRITYYIIHDAAAAVVVGFVPARREDYVIRLTVSYRGEETIPLKA